MKRSLFGLVMVATLSLAGCGSNEGTTVATTQQENVSQEDTTAQEETTVNAEENKTYEIDIKELIIKENGKEIYGKIYTPKGEGTYPVIIISHGYNGCHTDFVNECKYYAENGFIAYTFDFSGGSTRSKSQGSSTDMTIFTEKEDLLTVFDYFAKMDIVDKDRMFIFGGSQGGLVTSLVAEERKDVVKAMALYYPAYNIPDDWRRNYPSEEAIPETVDFWGLRLGRNFFMSMREFYTFENIGEFDKDILIIHGDKDAIVPMTYIEKAVEHYENAELVVLPGEGHGFTPTAGKKAMEMVLEFMKNH